jgi:GTP-binding protein
LERNTIVAIVGRPNVGKSTLFNRLSHKSKAIVIDVPGATRDRNYADCSWYGRRYTLIDTGGFEPASTETILIQMREQTHLAIEEADLVIFLMDGRDGLTPADIEISAMLREAGKTVFYAVNKVDGPRHEGFLPEFYRLGAPRIHDISAQHGLGIDELMDDLAEYLPPARKPPEEGEEEKAGERIRIALIGKPNVGKSSLLIRFSVMSGPSPTPHRERPGRHRYPLYLQRPELSARRHGRHPEEEPHQPSARKVQRRPGPEDPGPLRNRPAAHRRGGGNHGPGHQDCGARILKGPGGHCRG